MKLERIGEFLRIPDVLIWFKPDYIIITPIDDEFLVSIELRGKEIWGEYFKTESEAVEFAREIVSGGKDGTRNGE